MHIHGPRVLVMSQPVQSAQALRERPDAARLRDEVLRVEVRADLEGLCRDHDEVPLAGGLSGSGCRHADSGIENARPDLLGLAFAVEPGQQQRLGVRVLPAQALERLPRRPGRVGEDQAGRPLRGVSKQLHYCIREQLRGVARVERAHLHGLRGVQSLSYGRVPLILITEVETVGGGFARRSERGDARL